MRLIDARGCFFVGGVVVFVRELFFYAGSCLLGSYCLREGVIVYAGVVFLAKVALFVEVVLCAALFFARELFFYARSCLLGVIVCARSYSLRERVVFYAGSYLLRELLFERGSYSLRERVVFLRAELFARKLLSARGVIRAKSATFCGLICLPDVHIVAVRLCRKSEVIHRR